MKDLNVKNLRILRLRFGLVGIVIFYAPAKKETVANASGSERCVLIPWLFLFLLLGNGQMAYAIFTRNKIETISCNPKINLLAQPRDAGDIHKRSQEK